MSTRRVMIFSRFERFWHWSQVALIMTLMFTGFAVHGLHALVGFENAYNVHVYAAIALIVLWVFAIFWHLTTGTWKHYVPTGDGLLQVVRYYTLGIFKGEHHPYHKSMHRKHNPLQLLAYLGLKLFLFPAIWITGLLMLFYPSWDSAAGASVSLEWAAVIHTITAFAILIFVIAHVYMLTTGHSFREHVMPMVSGYDEVDLTDVEEAYLEQDEPSHIK